MNHRILKSPVAKSNALVAIVFTIASCQSGSGGSPSASVTSTVQITGAAILGPVDGATVTVFPINESTGALDESSPLATTSTDANGQYALTLASPPSGPIVIKMVGGSYKEEGSGSTVNLGSHSFTTLLPDAASSTSLNATLGPLPHMAYQRFQAQMASGPPDGKTVAQLATDANYAVSQAFGISDVVGVVPANPYGTIPNDSTGQYSLVLAGLSVAAASKGVDSVALTQAYASVFSSTGTFSPSSVTVTNASGNTVSLTPPSLTSLASTVGKIGDGTTALSGVTPPSGITAPTMVATPSSSAPPAYIPGAPTDAIPPPPPLPKCDFCYGPIQDQPAQINLFLMYPQNADSIQMYWQEVTVKISASDTEVPINQIFQNQQATIQPLNFTITVPMGPAKLIECQVKVTDPTSGQTKLYKGAITQTLLPGPQLVELPLTLQP